MMNRMLNLECGILNSMPMKDYYQLTKPGIIGGNAITVVAGFLLASGGDVDCGLMIATLVGLSLVVASGCVMNNTKQVAMLCVPM